MNEGERDYTLSRKAGCSLAQARRRGSRPSVTRARSWMRSAASSAAAMTTSARCGTRTSGRSSRRRCRRWVTSSMRSCNQTARTATGCAARRCSRRCPGWGRPPPRFCYGVRYHREQIELHGPSTPGGHDRVPVVYLALTSSTTMQSLIGVRRGPRGCWPRGRAIRNEGPTVAHGTPWARLILLEGSDSLMLHVGFGSEPPSGAVPARSDRSGARDRRSVRGSCRRARARVPDAYDAPRTNDLRGAGSRAGGGVEVPAGRDS